MQNRYPRPSCAREGGAPLLIPHTSTGHGTASSLWSAVRHKARRVLPLGRFVGRRRLLTAGKAERGRSPEATVGATGGAPDPTPARHLWLALRSTQHRSGELWEMASYVAIWLCGLIGIGLCLS